MTIVTEEEYPADQRLEVGLNKVKEVVQELCTNIIDLEARVVPTTPPEELAKRKEVLKETVRNLTIYEIECQQMYTHDEQT